MARRLSGTASNSHAPVLRGVCVGREADADALSVLVDIDPVKLEGRFRPGVDRELAGADLAIGHHPLARIGDTDLDIGVLEVDLHLADGIGLVEKLAQVARRLLDVIAVRVAQRALAVRDQRRLRQEATSVLP